MQKRYVLLTGLVLLLALAALLSYQSLAAQGADRYVSFWNRETFDSTAWNAGDRADHVGRYRMVPSLLEQYDFTGWRQRKVERLLGNAWSESDSTFVIYAGEEYSWDIDPIRGYQLVFATDTADRVTTARFECAGPKC